MKKKILTILAVTACVLLLMLVAGAETYGKFSYFHNGKGITILGYDGVSIYSDAIAEDVVIPSDIYGVPVTEIASNAFTGYKIASVEIPYTVETLYDGAFEEVYDLAFILVPGSVKNLGTGVFKNCPDLKKVNLPVSLTYIPDYTFMDCTSLESVTIPETVGSIGDDAFGGCVSLQTITIPSSVSIIGEYAFGYCTSLSTINFASDSMLTSIGYGAIPYGYSLYSVTNAQAVTRINSSYFDYFYGHVLLNDIYGTQILIHEDYAADYIAAGWTDLPMVTMYAPDGRTQVVPVDRVEAEKAVGWTDNIADVQTTVYAADGRSKVIFIGNLEAEKAVGWVESVTVYAADGRSKQIPPYMVEAERAVGWYPNIDDVMVTVYAADGRSKKVFLAMVEAEKAVGWFTEPVVTMYAMDGRTLNVPQSQVAAHKAVGWYEDPSDCYQWVYSLGESQYIPKAKVWEWTSVGWKTTPYAVTIDGYFDVGSYDDVNVYFDFYNNTGKTIDYFSCDVYFYNKYGGYFYCDIGNNYTESLYYNEDYIYGYVSLYKDSICWDEYNLLSKIVMSNIYIEYTDGSYTTINGQVAFTKE